MSEQPINPDAIHFPLKDGIEVEFANRQDALLFVANNWDFNGFLHVYQQIYKTRKGAARLRDSFRSPDKRKDCLQLMMRTRCNDGSQLFETFKRLYA